MKKQLLIAAVAATMTSVAFADVSITGAAAVNFTNVDFDDATPNTATSTHDFDLKISGKSGATTVVMDIENTSAKDAPIVAGTTSAEMNVKNAYMTTSIAGVNVKAGDYFGTDSLLGNGSQSAKKVSLDTTMSGIKIQYENVNDTTTTSSSSVTISGTVAGVKASHEIFETKTDSSVSGSFSGVNVAYRSIDDDTDTSDVTSLEVSTEVQGATLTYANIDGGTTGITSDAFFGTFATATDVMDADGFGVKANLAGNTVNLKSYTVTNTSSADQDYTKLVVTRPLASGTTVEATYTDKDGVSTLMDLELRVKF
jgi:hypothetical protein